MNGLNPIRSEYTRKEREGIPFLSFPLFEREDWLVHGISTRHVLREDERCDFNLGLTPFPENTRVESNRRLFIRAISAEGCRILSMRQVHSDRVALIHAGNPSSRDIFFRDGSLTREKGFLLPVVTADCAAVLLADPVRRAVGAVHAGWRGALQSIIEKTVDLFVEAMGTDPSHLIAAIGPSLGPCCFEVGEDVAHGFRKAFPLFPDILLEKENQKPVLNLPALIYRQLRRRGLQHENIVSAQLCTKCRNDLFYSYRLEGKGAGRILACIGIR